MLSFFKRAYRTISETVAYHFNRIFATSQVDEATLNELEKTLLEADTGVQITRSIIQKAREQGESGNLSGDALRNLVYDELITYVTQYTYHEDGRVYMLVGVNGSGKTTSAAKLAYMLRQKGQSVLLAAADTFRAAAIEQLTYFADTHDIPYVAGEPGQDPSSVVYTACKRYNDEAFDAVIIDTAGRLQTKQNLMQEISKMHRVAQKHVPQDDITTLITLDALLGQNSYDQAQLFHKATSLDGVILTKMDATAKGGIVFGVSHHLGLPIAYTTHGETIDAIARFEPHTYVEHLLRG